MYFSLYLATKIIVSLIFIFSPYLLFYFLLQCSYNWFWRDKNEETSSFIYRSNKWKRMILKFIVFRVLVLHMWFSNLLLSISFFSCNYKWHCIWTNWLNGINLIYTVLLIGVVFLKPFCVLHGFYIYMIMLFSYGNMTMVVF